MNREKILNFIRYQTINRLFELENFIISDFVVGGVFYILKNTLKLNYMHLVEGDSTGRTLSQMGTYEPMVKISQSFEHTPEIIDYLDLGDFVKIKLLTQEISVFSTKVVYLEINKKLLKNL